MTDDTKAQIRAAWAQGAKQRDLAQQFGVTQPYISKIVWGIPKVRVLHQRKCVDCGIPLRCKTRCEPCNQKWRVAYSQAYNRDYYLRVKRRALREA
jgi:hypothetical protein